MVVKFKGEAAFKAGMPLVNLRIVRSGNAQEFTIIGCDLQVTAHTAIGTDGTGGIRGLNGF
jgi:hypothetical protein